ncbi:hypothetical protein FIBSPDRAFT_945897 [Athelia psychrophila]|uniref:Osmotin, thaumatin-like protein n=1 Tax=Athelia psychrophila TaxID=1759441 RepID=A0A166TES4_9AGAM|nr:hypothetical protein FIBSPDRAFT_945897 [Fibularhizoctonia sp. CBS 109695]
MSVLAPILLLSAFLGSPLFANAQEARTVTFVNQCTSDVWFSPTTGAAGTCAAGCPSTSTCNTNNGYCYWNNPTPNSGTYRVPKGGSNSVTYPFIDNGVDTQWNGNWAFCQEGTTCTQTAAVCDSQGCAAAGPNALAEVDFSKTNSDYYDISIIAGVNVPVSITPTIVDSTNTQASNPYTCGNPGSASPATSGLGASAWSITPPSIDYQWVTPPSTALTTCSSASSCPSGQTCGLIYTSGNFEQVCGYLSGYWSAGSVCGTNGGTSYMNCDVALTNGPYTGTNAAFYGCGETSGSCYQPGADANCCGCVNWQTLLGTSYVPASTGTCVNNDAQWTSIVLPTIEFLKKGCPNCYTYPYDDFSSTFTCEKVINGYNTQDYTVTLCPNGVSWGGTTGTSGGSSPTGTTSTATPTSTASAGKCSGTSYTSSQPIH